MAEAKQLNVLAWASDSGAVGYYRVIWPISCLASRGLAKAIIFVKTDLPAEALNPANIIVFQRVMERQIVSHIRLLQSEGKKVVVEVDDDLLNIPKFNPVRKAFTPEVKENLKEIYRNADMVTVTTEPLAESIRKFNKNVVVLPNCLPLDLVPIKPCSVENGEVRICWSGSVTHEADNALITEALRYVQKKYPNVKLIVQSQAVPASWKGLEYEYVGRIEFAEYHKRLKEMDFHIGIAPLVKSKFNDCKSQVKFLDYTQAGAITIASNVPAYREAIEHGKNGFLATTRDEWIFFLSQMIENPTLRRLVFEKAVETMVKKYSTENNIHKWYEAYLSLV